MKIKTYKEFWPYYLSEHKNPINRALHYLGTVTSITLMIYAVSSSQYLLLLAAPVLGYGPAWIGHFFIEKNRPATLTYPFWSLISDFKMIAFFLTGGFEKERKELS